MRFTIRDLIWLTLVVGALLAWWLDNRRREAIYKQGALNSQYAIDIYKLKASQAEKESARMMDQLKTRGLRLVPYDGGQ